MHFEKVRLLLIALVMLVSNAQAAERAPIDAFLGNWMGVGLTENFTESYQFDYSIRDLDVNIAATDAGLDLTWTTHIRLNGTTKSKTTNVSLIRTEPGVFVGTEKADVLAGEIAVWGRIEEQSLIVYLFQIDINGIYDLSRYERRLSGNGRMFLYFKRTRDGITRRRVSGELVPAR